jgi:hypothetical protein
LRRAIRWVLDHPEAARRMGERARARAAWFTTERCMRAVHDLVTGAAENKQPPCGIDVPNSRQEPVRDACTSANLG